MVFLSVGTVTSEEALANFSNFSSLFYFFSTALTLPLISVTGNGA